MEEFMALLIPIVMALGAFTVAAFGIYFGYRKDVEVTKNIPGETLGEWYIAKAQAKALSKRGAGFRWGGFLVGAGLGTAIGCIILACGGIPQNLPFDENAIATFLIIALALFLGGAGMLGAYFLEKRLDGKA